MSSVSKVKNAAIAVIEKHPLQRFHSPSRSLSAILHLTGLGSHTYAFIYLYYNPTELSEGYGWHFKFLTIIGLLLSTITFILGLIADLTLSDRVFKWKNATSVLATPLEVVISILFWGLQITMPGSVVPDHLRLPLLQDFTFHLFPALFQMSDLLLLSPPWTINVIEAGGLSSVFAVGYWFWLEECYKRNGWYPYPLFAGLDTQQRAGVFAASAATFTICTLCLKRFYDLLNKQVIPDVKKEA